MSEPRVGGSRRRELKRAGVAAARMARAVLAEAVAILDPEVAPSDVGRELAAELTGVVATLFRAEVGGPEDVRDRLRDAARGAGQVLQALHEPRAARLLDQAGPVVARGLAILHPARAELDRELEGPPPERAPTPRPPPPGSERRAGARARIDAEVGYHSRSHFFTGRAGDVSTGGVFIATPSPLATGAEVTVGLLLPDGTRIVADGVVSWVRGPHAGEEGMGIRFTALTAPDVQAIERHLRSQVPSL